MKRTPILAQFQPRALPQGNRYRLDPAQITDELERLELLVPEVAHDASRNLLTYALAYIEHYQGDVLQLEHERELLIAALNQAWQQSEYAIVVRLVVGLAHLASRLNNLSEAEHILHLGIEASRRIEDRQHLAYFLNRLGSVLNSHGKYQQGWRVWHIGLQVAESSGSFLGLWEPLASFAQIADILMDYTTVQQFVETVLRKRWIDDPDSLAVIFFVRGFYARVTNVLDRAYEDLSCCLRFLSCQASDTPPSSCRQLFTMVVQTELARAQRDYMRSQKYTETALALAQIYSDRYTLATLLIDQVVFTYRQGQFADSHTAFLRLREVASQVEAPHLYRMSCFFEQQLARVLPESYAITSEHQRVLALSTASSGLYESLSEREVEVLQLVAEGLANREIAKRLVITTGTVKKHLEHIYIKLDVHSRTSATAIARALKMFL